MTGCRKVWEKSGSNEPRPRRRRHWTSGVGLWKARSRCKPSWETFQDSDTHSLGSLQRMFQFKDGETRKIMVPWRGGLDVSKRTWSTVSSR